MRIPPSMIVMSVVVAGLFGLGIRDTVGKTQRAEELDLTGERARARAQLEQMRAKEAAIRREFEERQRVREAKLDSLIGKRRGTPGPFFDGISLGAPMEAFQTEEARQRIYDAMADHFVEVSFRGIDHLYAIHVVVPHSVCDSFHTRLSHAWGASSEDTWLEPTTHVRATFFSVNCTLEFSSYLEPGEWVARLPFDAIGRTEHDVPASMPGTGNGHSYTAISIERDDHDRIKAINVVANADIATQELIRDAISARLGVNAEASTQDRLVLVWNTKPKVRLDTSGASRFSVQIGTPSWQ
jgi:hypothetical protein